MWFLRRLVFGVFSFRVQLAVNEESNTAVAVKIIPISSDKRRNEEVRKEMCIQKMCNHQNIIRLYGSRQDADYQYLILEYASGGELFDRIGNSYMILKPKYMYMYIEIPHSFSL
jgi:serine/threonine protein kinase